MSIFTHLAISPSPLLRQSSTRYAIRAGRNLPDKEFRSSLLQSRKAGRINISINLHISLCGSDCILILFTRIFGMQSLRILLVEKTFLLIVSPFLILSNYYKITSVISYKKFNEMFQHMAKFFLYIFVAHEVQEEDFNLTKAAFSSP